MSRFEKRQPETNRPLTEWDKKQALIAAGPKQGPDGRWEGCRHYIPEPYAVVGPEPHDHIKETA